MLWHKPNGSSSNLKIWMACQGKKGDLFDKQVWYFSPKYNNISFNFYNYPNPADDTMGIDIKDKKLRKISLKISTTESEYKNYLRRDNLNELVSQLII